MILNTSKNRQVGMTLIEIIIAMLLGTFLISGVLQIFTGTKQTYRMQENLSRIQENGRFAMEYISRDVRMADYWGCIGSAVGKIDNNLNPDPFYDDFSSGLEGLNDDNGGNDGDADNDENGNSIWDGSDSITLRGVSKSNIYVYSVPSTNAANLKVTDDSGLLKGEVVIVTDCAVGDILQITNDPGTGGNPFDLVVHNTGSPSISPGNAEKTLQKKYGTDSQILRINSINYKIQNGAGSQPSLFRVINGVTTQELVEGIENMQVLYGEDSNADYAPDYFVPAGTVGLNMDNVVSIRVSLLVTSIDDNLAMQPLPYTYNGVTTTPTDRKIRRVFSSTIAVRNRLR